MKIFRFIKKVDEYEYIPVEVDEVPPEAVQNSANQELYDIEEKEEELGISFILLVNILINGIYRKFGDDTYLYVRGDELRVDLKNKKLWFDYADDGAICFYFKDYGDIWALTKAELELPF